jgi:spore maturation protein CgeB
VEGALPVYLPEGANPEIHKPYDVERTVDVSFVGQCYGNRPETVERLRRQGIQVEAYGPGWPGGPLSTEEMVSIYSRSRINLGFAGVAGIKGTYCLKGRDFEIPMSGGLYLTEFHPELERWFDVGREIVAYVDCDDLAGKIRFLLANPQTAEEIRGRGFQRARREHSWETRFEKIFNLISLI